LNRRWRFCRFSKETYVVDSPCFLVSDKRSFCAVFGRFWTQVWLRIIDEPCVSFEKDLVMAAVNHAAPGSSTG
jgi:hypothetical protein